MTAKKSKETFLISVFLYSVVLGFDDNFFLPLLLATAGQQLRQ